MFYIKQSRGETKSFSGDITFVKYSITIKPKKMSDEREEQEMYPIEYIDPREFIIHPRKEKVQLRLAEKTNEQKEIIEKAFTAQPVPILPVLYVLMNIEGVEKMAIVDGEIRVSYAIKNGIEKIPARRVDIDDEETAKFSLVVNQNYHGSYYELGRAASETFKKLSPGQGKRSDISGEVKGVDIDAVVGAEIGITGAMAQKVRLVYEFNPEFLKHVDSKHFRSIAVALSTIRKIKKGINTDTTYNDGEEEEVVDSTYDAGAASYSTTETEDEAGEDIEANESELDDDGDEQVHYDDDVTEEMPLVKVSLPSNGNFLTVTCQCCNKPMRIEFVNLKN